MSERKLVSMVEFVLHEDRFKEDSDTAIFKVTNYANFLKQPLTLRMFVPCNEEGKVLNEPKQYKHWLSVKESNPDGRYDNSLGTKPICHKYHKAKERVLFEDVEMHPINEHGSYILRSNGFQVGYYKSLPNYFTWSYETIEGICGKDIQLTQSAIKQLGL